MHIPVLVVVCQERFTAWLCLGEPVISDLRRTILCIRHFWVDDGVLFCAGRAVQAIIHILLWNRARRASSDVPCRPQALNFVNRSQLNNFFLHQGLDFRKPLIVAPNCFLAACCVRTASLVHRVMVGANSILEGALSSSTLFAHFVIPCFHIPTLPGFVLKVVDAATVAVIHCHQVLQHILLICCGTWTLGILHRHHLLLDGFHLLAISIHLSVDVGLRVKAR
mmetsp:Transcript_38525/g.88960  ORF Transcript_38525/g.88960 Transcript_38525/m.88960 type:complete len:223 (+) Transcript_38525:256-924(+)